MITMQRILPFFFWLAYDFENYLVPKNLCFLFLVLFLYKFCPQFVPLHINNREKHTKYQYITNQFIFSASGSNLTI